MLWLNTSGPASSTVASACLLPPEEVRRQHLDRRSGQPPAQCADGLRPVLGAPIGQIVAVDRRHHDVAEPHASGCRGDLPRLERIERITVLARQHRAVAAGTGAGVSHDLEGRGAAPEALADVRAARLLADRVQAVRAQDALELGVARAGRRHAHAHPRRPFVREGAPRHGQTPVSISSKRLPSGSTKPTKRPVSESLTSPKSLTPRATMPPRKLSKVSVSSRTRTPASS